MQNYFIFFDYPITNANSNDIIMPIIGVIIGGIYFSSVSIKFKDATINIGMFIQNIIDFSAGLMAVDNFYSPFLSNQLLTNLNNNPRLPSAESVKKALNDYKNSGEELQGFVEFASSFDMIYPQHASLK